jgi:YbgC/YbaW family acyl-CoA thioester hydrolase
MIPPVRPPSRADFRCFDRLRVRWAEVDLMQVVFNGHYLMYVDTALGAYWRALGVVYNEAMDQLGADLFVRKASLDLQGSARYDDVLDVGVRCDGVGRTSMQFTAAVFRADRLLVTADLVYVFTSRPAGRPSPVPEALRNLLLGYEAGAEPIDIRLGDGRRAALQSDAQAVRAAVFVQEQGIPAELEWDGADGQAVHAVAYNQLGMAVGTGRLLRLEPGRAKIGRMAVRAPLRGGWIGRRLLDALVEAAQARGDREVVLHAQASAAGFYLRAGFEQRGAPFEEAGLPHVAMVRSLGQGAGPAAD